MKLKKTYIVLLCISISAYINGRGIATFTDVPTHNSWQAFVIIMATYVPLWILLWKVSKDIKPKTKLGWGLIRFCLFIWILGSLIATSVVCFSSLV